MTPIKWIGLFVSHGLALGAGFALGIYMLPILIAPPSPETPALTQHSQQASYQSKFVRDLRGSDRFHWGEGTVSISQDKVSLMGELAPGPDYKLYFSPTFVEDETEFNAAKPQMMRVADIKTFENFIVPLPDGVDLERFTTVVVWCETFGEFITAARYR